MNQELINALAGATQSARELLEEDFSEQLAATFDIRPDGTIAPEGPAPLDPEQRQTRREILAALESEHEGSDKKTQVAAFVREAAFTTLNRFVALKLLEARDLVQECISSGMDSKGFGEFQLLAAGLKDLPDAGFRLYLESIFDEVSTEVGVLFDRLAPGSLIWPRRKALQQLLDILNDAELDPAWPQDETIGWVYQYFNSLDERQEIRKEARSGPRNSRELAILNQFFTPRYVVEFLTDNTLGRLWWEMTQGNTELYDRCSYLMVRPDDEPEPLGIKDPRDLKVLDPACGSGHFLLYAFDLLWPLYREAWTRSDLPASGETGSLLKEDYPTEEALIAALPALILHHNLYGVDIDPRAAQIASLALWLRAQRAYQDADISRSERAPIRRTNVVVAEPLPGDETTAAPFLERLEPPLDAVARDLIELMELAGDAGTLLKIEDEIPELIKEHLGQVGGLFAESEEAQWQDAERALLKELRAYAEGAGGEDAFARRLFSEDTARGLAFIDLCRTNFDVVLMNPPFGKPSLPAKHYLESRYDSLSGNLLCGFISRGTTLLAVDGKLGCIGDRTVLDKTSYEDFRISFLLGGSSSLAILADLGWGVLDADVATAALTLERGSDGPLQTIDLGEVPASQKPGALREAPLNHREHEPEFFRRFPHSAIAHSVTDTFAKVFNAPRLDPSRAQSKRGISTGDTFRFFRLHWECDHGKENRYWQFAQKGGGFAPFNKEPAFCLNTTHGMREISLLKGASIKNTDFIGRPGLSWGKRTEFMYAYPFGSGHAFTDEGQALFSREPSDLLKLLAILNSRHFQYLLNLFCGQHKSNGYVGKIPIPDSVFQHGQLAQIARHAFASLNRIRAIDATSLFFSSPLTNWHAATLDQAIQETSDQLLDTAEEVKRDCQEIDHLIADALGLNEEDQATVIEATAGRPRLEPGLWFDGYPGTATKARVFLVEEVLSWSLGAALGRFDIRLATGDREPPSDPDPFDPLPVSSPGVLHDDAGLPAIGAPSGYPVALPPHGILVDDPGHPWDVITRIEAVLELVVADRAHDWLQEAEEILGRELREWLQRYGFERHLKRYSRSRRKAPLVWHIGPKSRSYGIWLYSPNVTRDSFYRILNDYVDPKLKGSERRLFQLRQELGDNATQAQQRELSDLETLVEDLRAFKEEVSLVAPLWKPFRDDGVVLNCAVLWRLFAHHRTWQKECRKRWEKLKKGEYDWAGWAMHLWPERAVKTCMEDRSIAIAHALEETLWEEDDEGNWTLRGDAPAQAEQAIDARQSAALQAALETFEQRA